jgi:hypothetical protein
MCLRFVSIPLGSGKSVWHVTREISPSALSRQPYRARIESQISRYVMPPRQPLVSSFGLEVISRSLANDFCRGSLAGAQQPSRLKGKSGQVMAIEIK